jgi:hypothetical protein
VLTPCSVARSIGPMGTGRRTGEPLALPAAYGAPAETLAWADVEARLVAATQVWLATARPDGRPHAVPVDALWVDGAAWFGGSPDTVKHRNLLADGRATLHLPDASAAVIVEGRCELVTPDGPTVKRLRAASKEKYGYAPPAKGYTFGVWRLRPSKVMAWTSLPVDATRFLF